MKKSPAIIFAVLFAVLMCVSVSAVTLDTAETAEVATTETEAALAEVSFTAVPGLNYFTGTEFPFDFEDADASAAIIAGMSKDVYDSITVGDVPGTIANNETYGKAMIMHRPVKKDWFHIKYNGFSFDGGERPYYFTMDNYFAFEGTPKSAWAAFVFVEKNASGGDVHYVVNSGINKWHSQTLNKKTPKNGWKLDLQVSMSEGGQGVASAYEMTAYVDNMFLVPYYKVTYMSADGSEELASEYVLFDDAGLILKEYTPKNSMVAGATGFALTPGGERVGTVTLFNQDVVLYALTTNEASFVANGVTANVEATGEYTFSTPEALGLEAENFRFWTDGENYYFAGDKLETGLTAGMTYKAVCFEPKIFDPEKGELVYFVDMEDATGHNDATYVNKAYSTGVSSRADGNEKVSRYRDTDGNSVIKLVNSETSKYQLFGYRIEANNKSKGGKASAEFDFKYITAATEYAKGGVFVRMLHTNSGAEKYERRALSMPADRKEGVWHKASVAVLIDTNNVGLTGAVFQYESLPTDKQMIQYIDNLAYYVYPAKTFVLLDAKDSEEYTKVVAEGDTYTMPAADVENAIAWTDGRDYYLIGETYDVAELQFKALYPFCQSADMPAVVSLYENGTLPDNRVAKFKYQEAIDDDGRDVLHLHQWASSWNSASGVYMNDARVHLYSAERFDASEYNIIAIMMKKNSAHYATNSTDKNTTYEESVASSNYVIYNYINANYSYVGKSAVANAPLPVDGKYHYIEIDTILNPNASYPWEDLGYGFAFDPNAVSYGGDTYIDYVRIYRDGIFSVTYDTNAPEGAEVLKNVAADTGRGLGYGYILKDERPEVEGYVFLGWAETADAEETVTEITLEGNTTVYAVWEKAESKASPKMTNEVEIKGTGSYNGIRFKSEILPSVKNNLDEFGFLATREVLLPFADEEKTTRDYTKLTLLHKANGENQKCYVKGVAYDADGAIDIINSENDDGNIIYTAVVSGIPLEKKNENMVIRPYAVFTVNGKEMVVYGDANSASLYDTAKSVKDANGEAYTANKAYIDSILAE